MLNIVEAYVLRERERERERDYMLYSCEAHGFTEIGYFIVGKPMFLAREHVLW
jgi:hypothetical protein